MICVFFVFLAAPCGILVPRVGSTEFVFVVVAVVLGFFFDWVGSSLPHASFL